jgi:hypothetical protein
VRDDTKGERSDRLLKQLGDLVLAAAGWLAALSGSRLPRQLAILLSMVLLFQAV